MSGEIEVTETPNWLKELEEKREKRLKARLGHEAGAGAPCLKCGDKCPGLDLHFWRKCCKNCKCPKEEHEVQDDDIYGWAQFQLLGSKPNKVKRTILLPGKKDEIDLEWVPTGHNETIDKYLKTLPPEQLPVKGSQAAQDRKQLLQKQIPIHDIDPTLCHELTEDELKKMNEYICHVKQVSAGVGQIVSLSSIIKGKLHMLNPAEAAIIASRYAKGVPISEIVKLQGQNKTSVLGQGFEKLSLKNKNLPQFIPSVNNQTEDDNINPSISTTMHDMEYPLYSSNDPNRSTPNAQFSSSLGSKQFKNIPNLANQSQIDQRYLQNPNFDPKNRPSNFVTTNVPYNPNSGSLNKSPLEFNSENSAFVPYQKATAAKPGDAYLESAALNPNFAKNLVQQNRNCSSDKNSLNMSSYQGVEDNEQIYENVRDLKKQPVCLPNYAPGKFTTYADVQSPTKIPKNVKDLAFSTYEPGQIDPNEHRAQENEFKLGKYRQPGSYSDDNTNIPKNSSGFRPIEAGTYPNRPVSHQCDQQFEPINPNVSRGISSQGLKPGELSSHEAQFEPISTNVYNSESYPLNSKTMTPGELGSGYSNNKKSEYFGSQNSTAPYSETGERPEHLSSYNPTTANQMHNTVPRNLNYGQIIEHPTKSGGLSGHSPNVANQMYSTDPSNQKYSSLRSGDPNMPNQMYTTDPSNQKYVSLRSGFPSGQSPNVTNQTYTTDSNNQKYALNEPSYLEHSTGVRSGDPSGRSPNSTDPSYQKYGHNTERTGENYPPTNTFGASPLKSTKQLSELLPNDLRINEDFLNPSHVNIGLIQDINYPDIKTATHETGDFYEEYSPDSIKEILNNVILPDCHYCKKPFEENEFAITIDRANVLFHAGCFKCAGCNQILADNVYFYNKDTDNIYCLRDYAKIRGFPRCKACDELIFTKEYCLAENSTFHLKHFCCTECDMPLAGQDYLLEDEMPYCLPCFEQNKASKCNSCGKVIKPDEVGCNLKGIHFHAVDACFACKVCKTPLMGKKFLLRNDQLYCSHECYGSDQ